MAKQGGPFIFEMTVCGVSFYKRCGVGCVRMKSNLTAERWRTDPAFEGSRLSAACMALASKLGSSFYQTIPQQQRYYPHYKQLVAVAQHMLCKGYNMQHVKKVLRFTVDRYLRKLQAADPNRKPERSPFAATLSLKPKPAFTKVTPYQPAMSHFTAITFSRPTSRSYPTILAPRGSPGSITGSPQQTETSIYHSTLYYLPFPMAGLLMPSTRQSNYSIPQKGHKYTGKILLRSFSLHSRIS